MKRGHLRQEVWAPLGAAVLLLAAIAVPATAQTDPAADSGSGAGCDYFCRVDKTQAEQPHWMTPLVTVTPRLEEEVRYDQLWQTRAGDTTLTNYGVGKGLELIPFERVEVIVGVPAYEVLDTPKGTKRDWADETFLLKYRAVAADEAHGNYIVTGFLGLSVPTGGPAFTANHSIFTPTLAAGKGWGTREQGADVQSTVSIAIPSGDEAVLGTPIVWNTAFQVHALSDKFWPEVELNYTHFRDGPNDGKNLLVFTTGVVLGRFQLYQRLRLAVGAGYEQAISSFKTFEHAWLLTVRTPF
ncbi:MAG TPA: hypothetical protein VKY89_20290 [Thermoanaerobaculia bacterium]|nr:hypothetical protein [Thermoanaerobaculia bacterium]